MAHYEDCLDKGLPPIYALSCDFRPGCDAREIALRSTAPMAPVYKRMRQSTVASMREIGLRVCPEGDRDGHGRIELGDKLDDEVLQRVQEAFGEKEDNPRYGEVDPL